MSIGLALGLLVAVAIGYGIVGRLTRNQDTDQPPTN